MNIGFKSAMSYVNKSIDKGLDKMESAISRKCKHMVGADIQGNGIARRMKATKKARNFATTTSALGYIYGAAEMAKGPFHMVFPGAPAFVAGIWQHCNAIEANKAINAMKPEFKAIQKRAKAIYG